MKMTHSLESALQSHNKVWQHCTLCNGEDLYMYMDLTCSGNQSPKLGSGELWDMQLSNPQQHMDK